MTHLKLSRLALLASLAGGLALLGWAAEDDEEDVAREELPAGVQQAITAEEEAGTGKATEIGAKSRGGKTVYEVDFVRDGKEFEVVFAADGTVLERDIEGEPADDNDVPPRVRAAFRKLARDGSMLKIESEREHGVIVYEGAWRQNGKLHEAAVMPDGTLIETEERIRLADAPDVVRRAVADHFPSGTRVAVEMKMVVVFEVEGRVDGREHEILVYPTGHVVGAVADDDNDHEDADDDEED